MAGLDPSATPWWERARFRLYLDFHMPDHADQMPAGSPPAFGVVDPGAIADAARRAGVDALVFYAKDNQGNSFYPTALGHHLSDLRGRDLVGEFVEALHRHGVRAVAYFQPIRDKRAFDANPAWRQVNNDGTERVLQPFLQEGKGGHRLVCPLGEAGERALEQLRELVSIYDLDGVWWDRVGDVQGTNEQYACVCGSCRERFRAETGMDIAVRTDWDAPEWRAFWRWRAGALLQFQRRARGIANAHGACLVSNYAFYAFAIETGTPPAVDMEATADASDVVCMEYHHWSSSLGLSIDPRLLRALTDRPVDHITWNLGGGGDGVVRSVTTTEAMVHTFLAHGHAVTFQDAVDPDGSLDPRTLEMVERIFGRARTLEPVLDGATPLCFAAVLFSPATFVWHGRGAAQAYVREIAGTVRQLVEAHVPFDMVSDRHVSAEGLAPYRLLVLPDVACLSDDACSAIEAWVRAGGVLLASGETSHRTSGGDVRPGFALGDVLGVAYERAGDPRPRWMRAGPGPLADVGWGPYPVPLRAPTTFVAAAGADVLADLGEPAAGLDVFSHIIPPARRWDRPAVTLNRSGGGHALYTAGLLAAADLQWGVDELAGPLRLAIGIAGPPPLRAEAPACVELIARELPPNAWVAHLVNLQGEVGRAHRSMGLGPLVRGTRDVLPVHDASLVADRRVARAVEVLSGQELDVETSGAGSRIVLPRLDVTACVRLDLG